MANFIYNKSRLIFEIDRLKGDPMHSRVVLLIEINETEDVLYDIDTVKFVDLRVYDLTEHEQCAIQFVREMIAQGKTPEPTEHRFIVIGGDMTVSTLEGTAKVMPVSRVPFTVWTPVPPPRTPQWSVKEA